MELWDSSVLCAPGADSWLVQSYLVVQLNLPSTFDSCGFLLPQLPGRLRWNVLLLVLSCSSGAWPCSPHRLPLSHKCLGVTGSRALLKCRSPDGICPGSDTVIFIGHHAAVHLESSSLLTQALAFLFFLKIICKLFVAVVGWFVF